jgi:sialidase-1
MHKLIAFLYFILMANIGQAQEDVTVFESGTEGYKIFRIPSIVQTPNNTILAFAEGRKNGGADFGDIKIVMKKIQDKGKTWSSIKVVASYAHWQVGNAAPVVDLLDPNYPNGKIYLFYNTGNVSEMELRQAKGLREVWYISSVDEGETWTAPVNITSQVHYPNGTMEGRTYTSDKDWRTYANTPGHATQCLEGKYKGRIFIAANHSQGGLKPNFKDYFSHGYYSDDHGKTFKLSSTIDIAGSNEATAAFLSNDRLILNARNQSGDIKSRIIAYSNNGGESFEKANFDNALFDPVCEGAILNIGKRKGKTILAFVNAADTVSRNNLSLKISFDEGKTWPIQKIVNGTTDPALIKKDFTAYADLIKMGSRKIGVFYEKENYSKMVFKIMKW